MKYHIVTFGCQMNERDSEILSGILENMGYEAIESINEADIILFNTCCIREKAENKALSQIGELKDLKLEKPDLIIGVCGCMVQQERKAKQIIHSLPHVDILIGTHNIHELPQLIDKVKKEKKIQVSVWEKEGKIVENMPYKSRYNFKSLVNIMYGCNNFCTYCIVPYVRGRERSRQPQHIINQIKNEVSHGVIEVMLLGQNVNSYGKDFGDKSFDFADLLIEINKIEGLKRIRYMTSHPRDFTDKLITSIARSNKVCKHFHLPVQAGSDKILKAMNRGYTQEKYLELIKKIRQYNPNAIITTDIIVGFPGETEADFQETLNLVKKVRFDSAYTFIYSPRKGTPAAKFSDQVPLEIKKERLYQLNDIINNISAEKNNSYLNKEVHVLVEGLSKNNPKTLSGKTEGNKTVIFEGNVELIGKIVPVLITDPQSWVLKGKLQEK